MSAGGRVYTYCTIRPHVYVHKHVSNTPASFFFLRVLERYSFVLSYAHVSFSPDLYQSSYGFFIINKCIHVLSRGCMWTLFILQINFRYLNPAPDINSDILIQFLIPFR